MLGVLRALAYPQASLAARSLAPDGSRLVVKVEPGPRQRRLVGGSEIEIEDWRRAVGSNASRSSAIGPGRLALAVLSPAPLGIDLDDQTIRHELEGNLCRCTGYHNIVKAIAAGAKAMEKGDGKAAAQSA